MTKYCYDDFCSENIELVKEYIAENANYIGEEGLLNIIENEIKVEEDEEDFYIENFSEYVEKVRKIERKYINKFLSEMESLGYQTINKDGGLITFKGSNHFKIDIDFTGITLYFNNATIPAADFIALKNKVVFCDSDGKPIFALERVK